MDEMIKKLISIDKQARVRVSKAKKERAGVVDELDKFKAELEAKNELEFKNFVESQNLKSEKELADARAEIEQRKNMAISKLNDVYAEKCDEWVDNIVRSVIEA